MENIVAVSPIPRPSAITDTAVLPGVFASIRKLYLK